ncbi:MAG: iron-only hydrogenase system regulator [Ruminococcaceae bacterium]|nr:iron-only hydrogenase system regulator [Oscillospiraceae bacterium]
MKTRVASISIIVENFESVDKLNTVLHDYGKYIIGRMGIPYPKRSLHIISVALEASPDVINTLTGKIGRIQGVSAKAAFSNYDFEDVV